MSELIKKELPPGVIYELLSDGTWAVYGQVFNQSDFVPAQTFAKMINKSESAVRGMIEKGKLPFVAMKDPANPKSRSEYWINLKEWNAALQVAYESRPKEIRDGWLQWIAAA